MRDRDMLDCSRILDFSLAFGFNAVAAVLLVFPLWLRYWQFPKIRHGRGEISL